MAEQIKALGIGSWSPGAALGVGQTSIEVYLPMELRERFKHGSQWTVTRHGELGSPDALTMVRLRPGSMGSRAHDVAPHCTWKGVFGLSRARNLVHGLTDLGMSSAMYAVTPAEVIVRLYHKDAVKLIRRKLSTKRKTDRSSDYLTTDAELMPLPPRAFNLSNEPTVDPFNDLRQAVSTINKYKRAMCDLQLMVDGDGELKAVITHTFC